MCFSHAKDSLCPDHPICSTPGDACRTAHAFDLHPSQRKHIIAPLCNAVNANMASYLAQERCHPALVHAVRPGLPKSAVWHVLVRFMCQHNSCTLASAAFGRRA